MDADVVEAACLAHDLGHPPFGHLAESTLNKKLKNKPNGFEGNAQTFRYVTSLAVRGTSHMGLNLSRATLNAILKYPWSQLDNKHGKYGHYDSERGNFDFARQGILKKHEKTIEADIMDWADDVAYSVHDVEDFYRAGLLPLDQLINDTPERGKFIDAVLKSPSNKDPKFGETATKFFDDLNGEVPCGGELKMAFTGGYLQTAQLNMFASILISRYLNNVEIDAANGKLKIPDCIKKEISVLKALPTQYVFHHPGLVAQQCGQEAIIIKLFDKICDSMGSKSTIVPTLYMERVKQIGSHDDAKKGRLAADIISSFTEQQAIALYNRLIGVNAGIVLDKIIR